MADRREWVLLIHQIPPKPGYFRVKVWRRLQRLGAVALKNSVYVLPKDDQTMEDFQWIRREIEAGGAEASICEATFLEGISNPQVEALFHAARDADYAEIASEATRATRARGIDAEQRRRQVERLRKRFDEVTGIDLKARKNKPANQSEGRV
jgi:Protein ChrB, N-terminal